MERRLKYLIDSNFWGWDNSLEIDTYSKVSHQFITTDGGAVLKVFMPGAKKADIFIKVEKGSYLCVEYKGKDLEPFNKKFYFDDNADVDRIKAEYVDGVLNITLPEKESFTKNIPIA